jgi:signal transduction histidine kinase
MNLLTNAARHAFSTDGITVRIWSDGEGAAIDVEDHGPGIPPEEITRIFHRHYQVQSGSSEDAANAGESTSLGLGLYIARQIVHAHDGQLMVASELGVGSRFTIYIPRR